MYLLNQFWNVKNYLFIYYFVFIHTIINLEVKIIEKSILNDS